mgnify:CR=1 FL=1
MHWEELPTALYPGEKETDPDASGVWTGSVIYGEGKYHAFYTGYSLACEYQQTICHATSDDGITWEKDPANPVILPIGIFLRGKTESHLRSSPQKTFF